MIDIHSHVLYGIDDGAQDIEESIEMCHDAYKNGCKTLVLTPHFFDFKHIHGFVKERNHRIENLKIALEEESIPLKLLHGAELFLSDKIFTAGSLDDLTINDSRYMLCEMPLGPFKTDHVLMWFDELLDRGYTPILAHPERYYVFHEDYSLIDEILDRPILLQVNIDSLRGKNGPGPQKMALDMINRKFATLIASDAHDPVFRHTRLNEKLDDLPDELSADDIRLCLEKTPLKVINNQDIL
ncbi:MAG: hypothetical protein J6B37_05990 [Clostridia bacterium]|nr:hypothetical protein [Clostridia bacterium]